MSGPDLFLKTGVDDEQCTSFLNDLFLNAMNRGVQDIQFLSEQKETRVRFARGETWMDYTTVDNTLAAKIDVKIRARAMLSSSERRKPLDGRIQLTYPDVGVLDLRVGIVPTIAGQSIVTRLTDSRISSLDEVIMPRSVRRYLLRLLREPNGLFLVCGPTGSGKSRTLYAMLQEINDGTTNIITVENPVEKIIPGLVQIEVTDDMPFSAALRAAMRQRPRKILIGEIRDEETAKIAIMAASTGHLVLATIHANNAASVPDRLHELGIERRMIADTLLGVLSQRLVDVLAKGDERLTRPPTDVELEWLSANGISANALEIPICTSEADYVGVVPIMELLVVDDDVRESILANAGVRAIFDAAARQPQFDTVARAGLRLVTAGDTTLEKIMGLDRERPISPTTKRLGQVLVDWGVITAQEAFDVAEEQAELRAQGQIRRFGQVLAPKNMCRVSDIVRATGCTGGARELLSYFVACGRIPLTKAEWLAEEWRTNGAGRSIFDLAVEANLLDDGDLNDEKALAYRGDRVADGAVQLPRAA